MYKLVNKLFVRRQFRAQLFPTLAYIIFMLLLLWLGYWQLDRAAQKTTLFQAFASGDTEAMYLEDALEKAQPRYQRVKLNGRFIQDKQYLIDNMVRKGQVGLHVLTPFRLDTGDLVMVNRGWISLATKHGPLTDLANLLDYSSDKHSITGRLDKMLRPGLLLETEIPNSVYPKTVQFPTFEQLSADLQEQIVPWQILLDTEPARLSLKTTQQLIKSFMSEHYVAPSPKDQKHGRRMFLLMFVLFFGPFLFAVLAKNFAWFSGNSTVNYGAFIDPAVQLDERSYAVVNKDASIQFRDRWSLLFFIPNQCDESCLKGVREQEAVHLLLNRDIQRVQLLAVNEANIDLGVYTKSLGTQSQVKALINELEQANQELQGAYIIDPKGFMALKYPVNADPKKMQKDLKRLLKYSRIG